MIVRCESDGAVFSPLVLPYPSAACRSKRFNFGGDLRIVCPVCMRGYFLRDAEHLSNNPAMPEVVSGPEPQPGDFVSDRVLTVLEA